MTDLHDLAAPYVLDALDDVERRRFERHLDGCAVCRLEVGRLQQGVDGLAASASAAPDPSLRTRVLSSIDGVAQEPARRRRGVPTWMTAVAAAAAVALGVLAVAGQVRLSEMERMREVLAAEDLATVSVEGPAGTVTFAYSDVLDRGVFTSGSLASVEADHTYQLWLIDEHGPSPANIFLPDQDRSAVVVVDGEMGPGMTLGLTVEPAGGSEAPTGDVLVAADL